MTTKDLVSNVDVAQSLVPAARSSGTGTGATVNISNYESATVEFHFGAVTDGTHTPSVQHSVDGTTFTDAGTDGYLNYPSSLGGTAGSNGAFIAVTAAGGTSGNGGNQGTSVQRVGYTGPNAYLRALIAVTSGTTGGLSAANVLRGHPDLAPLA